jgi:hypothetical protein
LAAFPFRKRHNFHGRTRPGSKQLSGGCGVLFFGVFLLAGIGAGVGVFLGLVRPLWRANHVYVESRCVVLDKRIVEGRGNKGGTTYRPEIHISYNVSGRAYQTWTYDAAKVSSSGRAGKQKIIDQFVAGREYPCWYDPDDPSKAVLVRGFSWAYLFILLPLVFVAVGAGGIYFTVWGGKKTRRKKMDDETAGAFAADASLPTDSAAGQYPTVPDGDLSDRPGTTLKYSLAVSMSPGCALFGTLFVALFWNGITSVFVVMAVKSHLDKQPEWFLTIFIIPFVLVGLVLIFAFFRQLLVTAGVGQTAAEISDHPLRPGGAYQVWISQSGNLQVNDFRALLVCEEEASYRQGTSTRTETKRVYESELFHNQAFEIQKGVPYETKFELHVPVGAMHSFEANHNKINWKLLVKGDIAGWPDFDRDFKLVVVPAAATGKGA